MAATRCPSLQGCLHARWIAPGRRLCLVLAVIACTATQQAWAQRSAPSAFYFDIGTSLYNGEFREAGKGYNSELRGSVKFGVNRWIDSICYYTMIGETFYQMGQLDKALAAFTQALELQLAHSQWLTQVQFRDLGPAQGNALVQVPWGQSKRTFALGNYPGIQLLAVGSLAQAAQAAQQGGVVQRPVLYEVYVNEIVRCVCLACRRRGELLGPAAQYDPIFSQMVVALTARPALPNHWSQVYVDVMLGVVYRASGKPVQAKPALERAIVAGGQYDHPLTSTVLLELGKVALSQGNVPEALNYFEEATYASVNYMDPNVLEDAFHFAFITQLASGAKGVFAALEPAAAWARQKNWRRLHTRLTLMAAESATIAGNAEVGQSLLGTASGSMARTDMPASAIGAYAQFVQAVVSYTQGNLQAGDAALGLALAFQQAGGSHWLYHVATVDSLLATGSITGRTAFDLYEVVLREPTPQDWQLNPLESLTLLMTNLLPSMQRWFDASLGRSNAIERSMEISDLIRRRRFFSTIPMGGRVLGLRWVLEGPPENLPQVVRQERQALIGEYPQLAQLSQRANDLATELLNLPVVPEDGPASLSQQALLTELTQVSLLEEHILHQVAVRRQPCTLAFPPFMDIEEVRGRLKPGQAMVAFFSTNQAMHAFFITHEKNQYRHWPIDTPGKIRTSVMAYLKELGNFEQNTELKATHYKEEKWKKRSVALYQALFDDNKKKFLDGIEELIIVPDGPLWYLPFESLLVREGEETTPLITKVRLRYAPTIALGVPQGPQFRRQGRMGVVLGQLALKSEPERMAQLFERFQESVPDAVRLPGLLPAGGATYATNLTGLVVLDRLEADETGPYGWAPLPQDAAPGTGFVGQWMGLPFRGPDVMVLPGFQSAAGRSLKGLAPANDGADLFLPVCALMGSGAKTVLISRWRTAGQSSVDLCREFVQELPHTTAADAWQRGLQVVMETPLDVEQEPRIKWDSKDPIPDELHPFFWANTMLVDTGLEAGNEEAPPAAAGAPAGAPAGAGNAPKPGPPKPGAQGAGGANAGAGNAPGGNPPAANPPRQNPPRANPPAEDPPAGNAPGANPPNDAPADNPPQPGSGNGNKPKPGGTPTADKPPKPRNGGRGNP